MLTRRNFLFDTAALAFAGASPSFAHNAAPTLLKLRRRVIEVDGKAASVVRIEGREGAQGLTTQVGAPFRVRVENELSEPSLVHWHGLTPPWRQDGVPGVSAPAIPPRGGADYDFPLTFSGTYWMHSHYGLQEQSAMSAPLIIRAATPEDRQDIVVMLNDFSFTPAQEIFEKLTGGATAPRGVPPMEARMRVMKMGAGDAMPMHGPDLNDVDYDAFLANDRTIRDPDVVKVENGGRLRLRIVNAASMTAFHVDLGALDGQLVAVDGRDVTPVSRRRIPIACAQRLDILMDIPKDAGACPIFFTVEGERRRTALILAPPGAGISRLPELAAEASAPLDLSMEAQLRALRPLAERKTDRTHSIELTGDMERYRWSINNRVWNEATPPFEVQSGERVELAIANRTMMSHPMHLHGHAFQVVEVDGIRIAGAMRDTVLVPPTKRVVVAFDADNPGHWAFHCHLLYHARAGMFSTFRYV